MAVTQNPSNNFVVGEPLNRDYTVTANNDVTPWILLAEELAVQVYGPATAITFTVQRSPIDPAVSVDAVVDVDAVAISGNPSTGIAPIFYTEPGAAWWRVKLTALTGASVNVNFSGRAVGL